VLPGVPRQKITVTPEDIAAATRPTEPAKPIEPVKTAEPPLFPHTPGDSWEYVETAGAETNQASTRVQAGKAPGEFTVEYRRNGELVLRETYRAEADGVYRTAAGLEESGRIVPPMPVLRLPLAKGASWSWTGTLKLADLAIPGKASFKVGGIEQVKSPAGTFDAWPVVQTLTLAPPGTTPQVVNVTQWVAPGVGLVRTETRSGAEKTSTLLTSRKVGGQEGKAQP
jgi:hypothetical protein